MGALFVLLLFKSSVLDQAINFFYRVRTNPVMALTQIWAKAHMKEVQKRKAAAASAPAAEAQVRVRVRVKV